MRLWSIICLLSATLCHCAKPGGVQDLLDHLRAVPEHYCDSNIAETISSYEAGHKIQGYDHPLRYLFCLLQLTRQNEKKTERDNLWIYNQQRSNHDAFLLYKFTGDSSEDWMRALEALVKHVVEDKPPVLALNGKAPSLAKLFNLLPLLLQSKLHIWDLFVDSLLEEKSGNIEILGLSLVKEGEDITSVSRSSLTEGNSEVVDSKLNAMQMWLFRSSYIQLDPNLTSKVQCPMAYETTVIRQALAERGERDTTYKTLIADLDAILPKPQEQTNVKPLEQTKLKPSEQTLPECKDAIKTIADIEANKAAGSGWRLINKMTGQKSKALHYMACLLKIVMGTNPLELEVYKCNQATHDGYLLWHFSQLNEDFIVWQTAVEQLVKHENATPNYLGKIFDILPLQLQFTPMFFELLKRNGITRRATMLWKLRSLSLPINPNCAGDRARNVTTVPGVIKRSYFSRPTTTNAKHWGEIADSGDVKVCSAQVLVNDIKPGTIKFDSFDMALKGYKEVMEIAAAEQTKENK